MTSTVVFVQPGFGDRGGVTADVVNLLDGVREHGLDGVAVGNLKELRTALRAHRHAVVHAFGCIPSPTIFGAIALARANRLPLVWTPIFNPIRPKTWAGYGVLRVMEAFDRVAPHAAKLADAVIAATLAEAEYFRSIGGRRVELIPPGVEPPAPPAARAELAGFRERLGLGDAPVILTVARDNSRKALPFGHDVFAAVRDRIPDARLLLVGPDRNYQRAADPGVVCPGWLDQHDMALAYQTGDVLFVSSLYEGLPRAVIEAWRWATPVVSTDRVALAPLIDGRGGLIARYGDVTGAADALTHLLGNKGDAASYGSNGRVLVETQFLMPQLTAQTVELYREVSDR
jgi:glycosyltransferase involved in cell wall biosynthesis